MAPIYAPLLNLQPRTETLRFSSSTDDLRQQWADPKDVMSVLLILGGEIVNRALAQLAGGTITPVAFSFGWVSYAITTLLASVGDARLMPVATDGPCVVVTVKSGYIRSNHSWIIDRMLRDYEVWMDPAVGTKLQEILDQRQAYMQRYAKKGARVARPEQTGLCVSVYAPSLTKTAGEPTKDLTYWSGIVVALVQLSIATIPLAAFGDWGIVLITSAGISLAFLTGALPQWKDEKWPCRRGAQNMYIMTRGNGAQHAIVILGNGRGLNLEDLTVSGRMRNLPAKMTTRISLAVLSTLWLALLVAAAGISKNTWFLLAIGGLGIAQNVLVVGWRRNPSSLGVHLEFREVFGAMTAMDTLLQLEGRYPKAGRVLLPIFFPGDLREDEIGKWKELEDREEKEDGLLEQVEGDIHAMPVESWIAHARTYQN